MEGENQRLEKSPPPLPPWQEEGVNVYVEEAAFATLHPLTNPFDRLKASQDAGVSQYTELYPAPSGDLS
jgi:hypothetical protein